MKKVYFACSIRAGRDDADAYGDLVKIIKKYADVQTEIFADKKLTTAGSAGLSGDIWSKDIRWLGQADAIIAEVTSPSLGVGYDRRQPGCHYFRIHRPHQRRIRYQHIYRQSMS